MFVTQLQKHFINDAMEINVPHEMCQTAAELVFVLLWAGTKKKNHQRWEPFIFPLAVSTQLKWQLWMHQLRFL